MNQIDLPTWLKLTNTKGLEATMLAPLVEAAHDEIYPKLVEYYFFVCVVLSNAYTL
jgi:hypothetical protein